MEKTDTEETSFACPLSKVALLEEWVQTNPPDSCPPCLIAPLASYYLGILQEAGEQELATELENTFHDGDALTIARSMDKIKASVGSTIKTNLENLDCMAQIHKESTEQI